MTNEAQKRKDTPIYSGVIAYFPDALAAVARVSKVCNEQHNPGSALHWDRSKSADEYDSCVRHLVDRAKGEEFDTDKQRHMAKVAWRALAALQKEIELARDVNDPHAELQNPKSQKNAEPKPAGLRGEEMRDHLIALEREKYDAAIKEDFEKRKEEYDATRSRSGADIAAYIKRLNQ